MNKKEKEDHTFTTVNVFKSTRYEISKLSKLMSISRHKVVLQSIAALKEKRAAEKNK